MKLDIQVGERSIEFCGLLSIAFIILKLCNLIKWSWLWVLSPIWIPVVFYIAIIILLIAFIGKGE